jgi:hypothetical protein
MTGLNVPIKSALVATVAIVVVLSAFAAANAAPDPAKRYRAEQITEEDVILQDPHIQVVLQNDAVQRLLLKGDLDEALERLDDILPWNFDALAGSRRPGGLDRAHRPPFASLARVRPAFALGLARRVGPPMSALARIMPPYSPMAVVRTNLPS